MISKEEMDLGLAYTITVEMFDSLWSAFKKGNINFLHFLFLKYFLFFVKHTIFYWHPGYIILYLDYTGLRERYIKMLSLHFIEKEGG